MGTAQCSFCTIHFLCVLCGILSWNAYFMYPWAKIWSLCV